MKVDRSLEIRRLRKRLAEDGVDPFLVAAQALESVDRLQQLLDQCRHSCTPLRPVKQAEPALYWTRLR